MAARQGTILLENPRGDLPLTLDELTRQVTVVIRYESGLEIGKKISCICCLEMMFE